MGTNVEVNENDREQALRDISGPNALEVVAALRASLREAHNALHPKALSAEEAQRALEWYILEGVCEFWHQTALDLGYKED